MGATSPQRAVSAREAGHFDRDIVAVTLEDARGDPDDGPRPHDGEKLAGSSPPSARRPPRGPSAGSSPARASRSSVAAIRPEIMASSDPVGEEVLEQAGLTTRLDFRLNEAFAAQSSRAATRGHRPREAHPFGAGSTLAIRSDTARGS